MITLALSIILSLTSTDSYGNRLDFRLYDDGTATASMYDMARREVTVLDNLSWEEHQTYAGQIIVWQGSKRMETLVRVNSGWFGGVSGNQYQIATSKLEIKDRLTPKNDE